MAHVTRTFAQIWPELEITLNSFFYDDAEIQLSPSFHLIYTYCSGLARGEEATPIRPGMRPNCRNGKVLYARMKVYFTAYVNSVLNRLDQLNNNQAITSSYISESAKFLRNATNAYAVFLHLERWIEETNFKNPGSHMPKITALAIKIWMERLQGYRRIAQIVDELVAAEEHDGQVNGQVFIRNFLDAQED